jgi:hypothetical protein
MAGSVRNDPSGATNRIEMSVEDIVGWLEVK